jgi:hypothetical protein
LQQSAVTVRNLVDTLDEARHHVADTVAAPPQWADQPAELAIAGH